MSGAQTSTGPNVLYDPLMAGRVGLQQNALAQGQQEISFNEMEQASRAANWVLTQDDKPAAYSTALRLLKANGYAKNSPDAYPGDAAMSYLARQSLTVPQQYNLGLVTSPASDELTRLYTGGKPPTAPGSSTPGATAPPADGGGGFSPDKETARRQIVQQESGGDPTALNYVARQDPTAYARGATASGKYQFVNSTWREGLQLAGLDPAQYATARDAPEKVQDQVFDAVYAKYGTKPWQKGPQDWVKDERGNYQLATVRPPPGSPGGAPVTAAAAPPGGGVAARYPGAVQAAGPAVGTAPTAAPGAAAAPPAPVTTTEPETGLPVLSAPPNQVMPGQPNGPPAATPPPAAVAPPAATPPTAPAQPASTLPHASELPTGQSSPQVQQAQALLARAAQIKLVAARQPGNLQLKAQADAMVADLTQKAQNLMQSDSVVQTQEGQVHTLTGKIDDPAKPLSDYHETTPGSGIWVGGPGTEPRFQPPGRLIIDKAGDVWRTTSGGAEKLSRLDPQAVSALNAAEAAGTATGKAVAAQLPALVSQGRNAAQAIGNIDYGSRQLAEAEKGGLPTGKFSPWLAEGAAALKSLGLTGPLEALGINPDAIGNIQSGQKTLGVVAGAILQQVIGKDSQITDSKIDHFIHTQPGIETDPQAVRRILNWARTQFVYEQEMAKAAVDEAGKPENPTGTLPMNWQARYYREHGFAPIYDPVSGEMQQPEGRSPSREPPGSAAQAPVNPSERKAGTTYPTPKGPMKWTGTGWVPP